MSLFRHLHRAPAGGTLKTVLGGCLPTTQMLTLEEASWVSPSSIAAVGPVGVAAMGAVCGGVVCHWWHPKWPQGFQSFNVPTGLASDSLDLVLVVTS